MNKIELQGIISQEPKYSHKSKCAVTKYTVAVKTSPKSKKVNYIRVAAFAANAETARDFKKGMEVKIVGILQTGSYTDRHGNTIPTIEVNVSTQESVNAVEVPETTVTPEEKLIANLTASTPTERVINHGDFVDIDTLLNGRKIA